MVQSLKYILKTTRAKPLTGAVDGKNNLEEIIFHLSKVNKCRSLLIMSMISSSMRLSFKRKVEQRAIPPAYNCTQVLEISHVRTTSTITGKQPVHERERKGEFTLVVRRKELAPDHHGTSVQHLLSAKTIPIIFSRFCTYIRNKRSLLSLNACYLFNFYRHVKWNKGFQ